MLGTGMLVLGIPMAVASSLRSYREARDRSFVWTAMVACFLMVLLSLAELAVPGGVIRRLLP